MNTLSFSFSVSTPLRRAISTLLAFAWVAAIAYPPAGCYTGPATSGSQFPFASVKSSKVMAEKPASGLSSLALSPAEVIGGRTSLGVVTLTAPAGAQGANVSLSSNSSRVLVPQSVSVSAGSLQATFIVRTLPTEYTLVGIVSGSYRGASRSAALTVSKDVPPVVLSAFSLSPSTVIGGGASVATLTLSQAAPAGGAVVSLSSSNPAVASVPASVTIPAGLVSVTTNVSTVNVPLATAPVLSASFGGVSKSAVLTVLPAGASLVFSSYLGGGGEDSIRDMATDSSGCVYVTGGTASSNFPTTPGAYDSSLNGIMDVYVAKFDPSGSLLWCTLIGGPNYDRAYALEVDSLGFVYVAGRAGAGFPTTSGALQRTFAGDVVPNPQYGQQDGFVLKLSQNGTSLVWSTYFGSDGRDFIRDLSIDASGNVYVGVSDVTRPHPRITSNAFQRTLRGPSDGVVAKISANGSSVGWASYFGGSADDGGTPSIRVGPTGDVYYLTHTRSTDAPVSLNAFKRTFSGGNGSDLMLARISANGSQLVFSTYFGGPAPDFTETHGLAVDSSGNACFAITTQSTSLPTTTGAFQRTYGGSGGSGTGGGTNYPGDVYIGRISANGTQLLAGTYLGGRHGEGAEGIALDSAGNVHVSGTTYSDNFAVTTNAVQTYLVGVCDVFVAKLTADLRQIRIGSYFGGHSTDLGRTFALDQSGNMFLGGMSQSMDWPLCNPFQSVRRGGWDGVLAKISRP